MKLKILSWNIWCSGIYSEIEKFLKDNNPDIILLQEVMDKDPKLPVVNLLKDMGYEYVYIPVIEVDWLEGGYKMGNAIFSKYPIVSSKEHWLSVQKPRLALQADIKIEDKIFHFFSIHLLHTHQQESEIQNEQINDLLKVLPKERVIIGGDFNSVPESYVIKKMEENFNNSDKSNNPTWCLYEDGCPRCKKTVLDIRLDYIFLSNDIKSFEPKVEESKASDHLPISVIIEI